MEYWLEGTASTAIPPTSAPDVVGQYSEVGGIIFQSSLHNCQRK